MLEQPAKGEASLRDRLLCFWNQRCATPELLQLEEPTATRRSHVGGGVSVLARDEDGDGGPPPTFRHLGGGVKGLDSAADVAVALAQL
eukprot:CAMPEP_0172786902 /NCGR_PEP_ID=MMETSP1074-20121228/206181_1 /TAXON_ID=2916 /ORGANISM="Ceratium fusus, Strain PA161109" /LENGTH=87 /DNA_ID=CAMNT_0013623919 /DNA_START=99 /DNA_END=363 /DNA_ORIENTATION=+